MTPFLWLLIGLFLGAPIGLFTTALLVAASRADAHLDATSRRQAEAEQRVWDNINRQDCEEHA